MARSEHLVLLPGLLCDAALWQHQIEGLGDRCQIMVGDLTRGGSIADIAEEILDEAPTRFALAGLSMGGYVAQEIMRKAPDRVERLALVDTKARADTVEQRKTRESLIRLADVGKFKGVTPKLLPNLIHPSRMDDPGVAGVVMEMAERVGQEAFKRQQTAILGRKDGRADLYAVRVPTLILAGREDLLCPPETQEEMAAHIPNARLELLDVCGHLAPLERPAETNKIFDEWLG
jgi:pimeloyl-ACP methyl ester carboxylesterase